MPQPERARVIFPPHLHDGLQRGTARITAVVQPTIGPSRCHVAVDRPYNTAPELLDDAGVIARRITGLCNRTEDVGAMLLRGLLWKVREQMGDGAATTAIIFDTVYRQGLRYLAAGGDAMRLRDALDLAIPVVEQGIAGQVRRLDDPAVLARLAENTCHDTELATALASVIDVAGAWGRIDVRQGTGREIGREFVEGSTWLAGELLPRAAAPPVGGTIHLEQAGVLVTDLTMDTIDDIRVLEEVVTVPSGGLVMFAGRVTDRGRYLLAAQPWRDRLYLLRLPGGVGTDERIRFLADISVLTGTVPVLEIAGQTLSRLTPAVLGSVRRAWIGRDAVGIAGGGGDPRRVRDLIASSKAALTQTDDRSRIAVLRERIGRLQGGSVTLHIGGRSQPEITRRVELAERAIVSLRVAMDGGVVPGAGASLLACRASVRDRLANANDPDIRAAARIVCAALEAPARAIMANAGLAPAPAIAEMAGSQIVDARTGLPVDAWEAGILDIGPVLQFAVRSAIGAAAQALTIGALVQHRKPAIADVEG